MAQHGRYEEGHVTVGRNDDRKARQEQARRETDAEDRERFRRRRSI